MEKGWNYDYIKKRHDEFKVLSEETQDKEEQELYSEICEVYKLLMFKLLFQEGKVCCEKVTTKDFLNECNGITNLHIHPEYYNRMMNKFALEAENSPKIIIPNYRKRITKEESFDIVGMFIEHYFGDEALDIYESSILKRPEYILFDKDHENSSVAFAGDESFIALADFNDIRFTSALAHEAGHIAKSVINNTPNNHSPLGEFESFSYQIRLLIFMINRGIYARDALKELLGLMSLAEKMTIVKRYNSIYKLNMIKNPEYFDKRIEELKLGEKISIKEYRDIFDAIVSVLEKDYTMYIYSLLAVFGELDNPDYLSTYYGVLMDLGYENQKSLVRRNNISISRGMKNYKQLRSELIRLV